MSRPALLLQRVVLAGAVSLVVAAGVVPAAAAAPAPTPAATGPGAMPGAHDALDTTGEVRAPETPLRAATAPSTSAVAAPVPAPVHRYAGEPEGFAPYVPQVSCDPVARPGTARLRDLLQATYGGYAGGMTRPCSGRSEHSDGRAYDWMVDVGDPEEEAQARAFLDWLVGPDAQGRPSGNARRLGVMYVIRDHKIWGSYNRTWKTYTGADPHTDHVHISLSWDGAMGRTSFWTGTTLEGTDYGPCARYVGEPVPTYSGRNPAPCPAPTPRPAVVDPVPVGAQTLVGDWDGDGRDQVGLFVDGAVSLRRADGSVLRYRYGSAGDVAVVGDWDHDGKETVGVFRRGQWLLKDSLSGGGADRAFWMGQAGDVPVVGRWNGRDLGVGVYRDGRWMLTKYVGAGPVHVSLDLGRPTDRPLVGDWDGDGSDTPGLQRGQYRFSRDSWGPGAPVPVAVFGRSTMVGFAADTDGDGRDGWGVRVGSSFLFRPDTRGGTATTSLTFAG